MTNEHLWTDTYEDLALWCSINAQPDSPTGRHAEAVVTIRLALEQAAAAGAQTRAAEAQAEAAHASAAASTATARATWWLVLATWVLALVTLGIALRTGL